MKDTKKILEQCLESLPSTASFSNAKIHIANAIREIHKAEKSNSKKAQLTIEEKWKLDLQTGTLMAPKLSDDERISIVNNINKMISIEEENLKTKNPAISNEISNEIILD